MNISELMSVTLLDEMIRDGFVSKRKHPEFDLYILNYSAATQYDWKWNEVTMQCRGLIVDGNNNVVARPWPKFFTFEQWTEMRNHVHNLCGVKYKDMFKGSFKVYDKVDGSMGILYNVNGVNYIASRGSFESDQAKKGTEILHNMGEWARTGDFETDKYTTLFEIIYPDNRIVVDYGTDEKLVLLSVLDTKTGKDHNQDDRALFLHNAFEQVKEYDGILDYTKLSELERDNAEGFVLHFENGIRAKFKYNEYKRLHRIMTNFNENDIFETLVKGEDIREIAKDVPDEFYKWIETVVQEYQSIYDIIYNRCLGITNKLKKLNSKKEMALQLKSMNEPYSAIIFAMVDNKNYSELIWKKVKDERKLN